jgi:hypothetical protein
MSLYDDVVAVLREEIGPSAPILLDRCCRKHLRIQPAELAVAHLVPLADCCCTGIRGSLGEAIAERLRVEIIGLDRGRQGGDRS